MTAARLTAPARSSIGGLVLALALCSAGPAHAGKGSVGTPDPRACHGAQDAEVLATSKYGVVYKREAQVLGCLYNDDVERLLPNGGSGIVAAGSPKLAGRFVAYVVASTDAEFVALYDLRAGRLVARHSAVSGGGVDAVRATVVKANGSFAWIGQGPRNIESQPGRQDAQGRLEVHRHVAGHRRSRLVSAGDDISRSYLALSRNRESIFWKQGGYTQRARLP